MPRDLIGMALSDPRLEERVREMLTRPEYAPDLVSLFDPRDPYAERWQHVPFVILMALIGHAPWAGYA